MSRKSGGGGGQKGAGWILDGVLCGSVVVSLAPKRWTAESQPRNNEVDHMRLQLLLLAALLPAASACGEDSLSDDLKALTDLATRSLEDRALKWECVPSARYVCTSEGCERNPGGVSVRLNFRDNTYDRCDSKGCDSHPMTAAAGGIFTSVSLPGSGGTFLKVLNDGSQYVEAAALHLAVHQNFGACKPMR